MVDVMAEETGLKEPLVEVNEDECKGCGLCIDICPQKVLFEQPHLNRMGYHPSGYTGRDCTGCAHCFYACPEPGAIAVYRKGYIKEEGK
jgi:NAD-dependent dihydropyrimidine dehydrogenase PreA subunit